MFKIDFKKLVILLLPTFWRERKFTSWLIALVSPISTLYSKFMNLRKKNWYDLNHNGQVCYLEKALNDKFDNELRRIEISDGSSFEQKYIYTKAENRPVFLGTFYIHNRSEIRDTSVDFIVKIPYEVYEAEKQMTEDGEYRFFNIEGLVNYYKLASKRYEIVLK